MACGEDGCLTPLTSCSVKGHIELSGANIGQFTVLTKVTNTFYSTRSSFITTLFLNWEYVNNSHLVEH